MTPDVRPRHITLSDALSRLYRHRFWRPMAHFAAFFEIYKIFTLSHRLQLKNCSIFRHNFENFHKISQNYAKFKFRKISQILNFRKILNFVADLLQNRCAPPSEQLREPSRCYLEILRCSSPTCVAAAHFLRIL